VFRKLFKVTLPWNSRDPEEGDYCDWTWAASGTDAIRQIADQMADDPIAGIKSEDEREEFIDRVVKGAGRYAAEIVKDEIIADVETLLKGENGSLVAEAEKDLDTIKHIISRYC
jgi:hypothetical protein